MLLKRRIFSIDDKGNQKLDNKSYLNKEYVLNSESSGIIERYIIDYLDPDPDESPLLQWDEIDEIVDYLTDDLERNDEKLESNWGMVFDFNKTSVNDVRNIMKKLLKLFKTELDFGKETEKMNIFVEWKYKI